MSGKRQHDQKQLAFLFEEGSEAPNSEAEGTETLRVVRFSAREHPKAWLKAND